MDRATRLARVIEILRSQASFAPTAVGVGSGVCEDDMSDDGMPVAVRRRASVFNTTPRKKRAPSAHALAVRSLMKENPGLTLGEASKMASRSISGQK